MEKTFEELAADKWMKGHLEHQRPWTAEAIDWRAEAKSECYDLYNYMEFAPEPLRGMIRGLAKLIWSAL